MESTDLEEVPITDDEKRHLVEAWLSYVHAVSQQSDPDAANLMRTPYFRDTLNRILLAHDFEPFSAEFQWDPGDELVVLARRLPRSEPMV